jgi:acyl-CoA reductase-like NAD-dependent aldehyde dehydrogenase
VILLRDNISTIHPQLTEKFTQAAKNQEDVDAALDAAHEAFPTWSNFCY